MIGNGSKNQKGAGLLCFFERNNDFKGGSYIQKKDLRMVPLE